MTKNVLDLLSGLLLIGGAIATLGWLAFAVLDPGHKEPDHPRWFILNGSIIAGGVLMGLGLPGFYFRQSEAAGTAGFIAYMILFVGIVVPYVAVHSIETATAPNIPRRMMRWVAIGAPSIWIGTFLMAVVTLKAAIYPPAAWMAIVIAGLFGLLTVLPSRLPVWLTRNVSSAGWTLMMAYLGYLSLSL